MFSQIFNHNYYYGTFVKLSLTFKTAIICLKLSLNPECTKLKIEIFVYFKPVFLCVLNIK